LGESKLNLDLSSVKSYDELINVIDVVSLVNIILGA